MSILTRTRSTIVTDWVTASRVMFISLIVLNAIDFFFTLADVTSGIAVEGNPVIASIHGTLGWTGVFVLKVAGPALLGIFVLRFRELLERWWFFAALSIFCVKSMTGVLSGVYTLLWVWMH